MVERHEYSTDELRDQFLQHLWSLIYYWNQQSHLLPREQLEGLTHSILVALDGESDLPAFIVAPNPHPQDKKFAQETGGNWYPTNDEENVRGNISGTLHEVFYAHRPRSTPSTK